MRRAQADGKIPSQKSGTQIDIVLDFSGWAAVEGGQKTIFVETRILFGKVFCKVQGEDFDNFILCDGSVLFFSETLAQDFCKGFEVFFCHGVIVVCFVVRVKRFF